MVRLCGQRRSGVEQTQWFGFIIIWLAPPLMYPPMIRVTIVWGALGYGGTLKSEAA